MIHVTLQTGLHYAATTPFLLRDGTIEERPTPRGLPRIFETDVLIEPGDRSTDGPSHALFSDLIHARIERRYFARRELRDGDRVLIVYIESGADPLVETLIAWLASLR